MKEQDYKRRQLQNKLNLFLELSNEEFEAYLGHIPMTQELFEGVLRGCALLDNLDAFVDMRDRYPEYMARLKEKIFITKESNAFVLDNEKRNR